jgi:hypothetical protein
MLRCKHGPITGISDGYAAELTAVMMSPKPISNLYAMRDALADFMYSELLYVERFDADDDWYAVCRVCFGMRYQGVR